MDETFARNLRRSINRMVNDGSSLDITREARNALPVLPFLDEDHHVLSSYKINDGDGLFYMVICNWRRKQNYYLMIFGKFLEDANYRILAELHETDTHEFFWRYSPRKRDRQNEERRRRFESMYGSLQTRISLPSGDISMDDFLRDLLSLADFRKTADDLSAAFSQKENEVFPEGRRIERLHKARERSSRLVAVAKDKHSKANGGSLPCEVCGFDFRNKYGDRGIDFIEAHHKVPLKKLDKMKSTATRVEDLAMVCANCHRMLHRSPLASIKDLRKQLRKRGR